MIRSNNFFTIPTFSLSRAYMIFLIADNPKVTFTTIIHKLANRLMLLRFHCLMLSKTVSTTKCSFTVHTTRFLSRNTRNVTIATITSFSTSVVFYVLIYNIIILTVVYTSTKSCHLHNRIIVIYSIEVNMDHPPLRLLLNRSGNISSFLRY